jgi:hypothetical protein
MEKPQIEPLCAESREGAPDVDREWLAAQVADETEYWRARAEAFGRAIDELTAELEIVHRQAEIAEAWRRGLAAELLEGAGFSDDEPPDLRAAAPILVISLLLWALLGLLALAAYRFLAG